MEGEAAAPRAEDVEAAAAPVEGSEKTAAKADETGLPEDDAGAMASLVGRRVRVGGHPATIRWGPGALQAPRKEKAPKEDAGGADEAAAAPPPPSAAVAVVGIEYDEPGLGKHDGTYQGTRLFACEDGFGSFAKVDKVELGMGLQAAWSNKFLEAPDDADKKWKGRRAEDIGALEYINSKGQVRQVDCEFLGRHALESRQKRMESFINMSLGDSNLASRYPDEIWPGDFSFPRVQSLWLDNALLSDWRDVAAICEKCPQLTWLSLARNRLKPAPEGPGQWPEPDNAPAPETMAYRMALAPYKSKLKTLILTHTMVTWKDMLALDVSGLFPQVEELHLSQNRLTEGIPLEIAELPGADVAEGEGPRKPFPKLRILHLDDNGIRDWFVLRRAVATFPFLETLSLHANLLGSDLDGLAEMAADTTPRRLNTLNMNDNKLSSWAAVGALTNYALLDFKSQRNPITEGTTALISSFKIRQMWIALMPYLLRLNGSEVSVKERTTVERDFLSAYQADDPTMQALKETCDIEAHRERLSAKHGDVVQYSFDPSQLARDKAIASNIVEVTLIPVAACVVTMPRLKKRLPRTMTVGELRRLCVKLFKDIPLLHITLMLEEQCSVVHLEDDARDLSFYGCFNGANIRIDDTREKVVTKGPRVEEIDDDEEV